MDCTGVATHLVAYHVGVIDDDVRDAIEAHLVECSACVKTYLALKRAADRATSDDKLERPRPEVKARLRAEVLRSFPPPASVEAAASASASPPPSPSRARLFARRIPLYQGVALAAIAAAIALALPGVLERIGSRDDRASVSTSTSIDTSRTKAESLDIY